MPFSWNFSTWQLSSRLTNTVLGASYNTASVLRQSLSFKKSSKSPECVHFFLWLFLFSVGFLVYTEPSYTSINVNISNHSTWILILGSKNFSQLWRTLLLKRRDWSGKQQGVQKQDLFHCIILIIGNGDWFLKYPDVWLYPYYYIILGNTIIPVSYY